MNDDRRSTDEQIGEAARELYNAPPSTPRDEMWSAIEARLGASGDPIDRPDAGVIRLDDERRRRLPGRAGWWFAIAAALVVGLGIGRLSLAPDASEPRVAAETGSPGADAATPELPGAQDPETSVAQAPGADEAGDDVIEGADPGAGVDPDAGVAGLGAEPGAAGEMLAAVDEDVAGGPEAAPDAAIGGPDGPHPRSSGRPYAVATRQHLDRSGTFLAGLEGAIEGDAPNPELEAWARSLLTRTRVLMASPAARDAGTQRLLEDLELMLAQIVVTAATGDPAEARILGEGLQGGDLLFRLRSASENERGPGAARIGTSSL